MRRLIVTVIAVLVPAGWAAADTAVTKVFQNGMSGYTGTVDRLIDDRGGVNDHDGNTVTQYFLDGYAAGTSPSNEAQLLMRFDNLIGSGPNQIPANATILSANLTVNTSTTGNAQSAGPWAIAQLNQPFTPTTTYFGSFNCGGCTLGSRGAWWEDNYTQRPLSAYGNQNQGDVASADITSIVQSWASGAANNGLVVQTGNPAGTTDGWGVLSTAHPLVQKRPKLEVTYTTGAITRRTYQQGDANGYSASNMAWVRSGANIFGINGGPTAQADASVDDITYDGQTGVPTVSPTSTITPPTTLTSFQTFLDGPQFNGANGIYGEADSADDFALIKFGNVFGPGANQSPNGVQVAKAWLVLSTGTASTNAMSSGAWEAHAMLRPWTAASLHSGFGATPGLQEYDGDIGPMLDSQIGVIYGSQVWFDVTSYLEAVRTGTMVDNGLAIFTTQTADGWQIHLNGSDQAALRPQLVVLSGAVSNPVTGLPGDYNGNGTVDAADYVLWRNGGPLANEGDNPGTVDAGDYNFWRAHYGQTASGSSVGPQAVPEPASIALVLAGALGLCLRTSRKDK
ncbi:MAG: DNRLRE domain-containing protein [Pirellulales bacterium]